MNTNVKTKSRWAKLAFQGVIFYMTLSVGYNGIQLQDKSSVGDAPMKIGMAYDAGEISDKDLCPEKKDSVSKALCESYKQSTLALWQDPEWREDYDAVMVHEERNVWLTLFMPHPFLALEKKQKDRVLEKYKTTILTLNEKQRSKNDY
jgi:hypothetical protein